MIENDNFDNAAPIVYTTISKNRVEDVNLLSNSTIIDPIDSQEVYDYIRNINDPEHPYSLEQLKVVQVEQIKVVDNENEKFVDVLFTPTIPHCSMATLIGLAIFVKLKRSLNPDFKVLVRISPGTHNTEEAINRQLADKERVAAALENPNLMVTINNCLRTSLINK